MWRRNKQGYLIKIPTGILRTAGMRCLEWRLESYSVQFSQFRNTTRQIHQILQNLTQAHTICLGFVGYWPQHRVLSRNMTGIKSIGRYQHVRYSAHKINRYYFSSASAFASMNSVKTVSQTIPCWFFLWDLSCAQQKEQGAIMGAFLGYFPCNTHCLYKYAQGCFKALKLQQKTLTFSD